MAESSISENSRRIARNTFLLYFRMVLMLLVGLYTSRVILNALGQDDFGTYGAVGGVVALFGILTGSLSNAISRFLSFELGKDNPRLKEVFSTIVMIQILISVIVFILAEGIGVWFLNNRMVIPDGRMHAANYVLQCSILMFIVNLLSVPYNAAIIAHEKMEAFAYISIAEAFLALGAALTVRYSSSDRLILYAVLMLAVAIIVRFLYSIYAHRHFQECRFRPGHIDKSIMKGIGSYAGWTFLGNATSVVNSQGINILMNLFFGVRVNAARDVTVKLQGNVSRFIFNITTAINPQINKSYASGRLSYMHELVSKGARYSYLLFWFFALPILLETPSLLHLWLGEVPRYSVEFVRISLLSSLLVSVGNPFATAIFATGHVKSYQIVVSITCIMAFPLSYIAYKAGCLPQMSYWIILGTSVLELMERVWMSSRLIKMPLKRVLKDLVGKLLTVTVLSAVPPVIILLIQEPSLWRTIEVVLVAFVSVAICSFFLGTTPGERSAVTEAIRKKLPFSKKQ